jgi:hypothetical protein
MIGGRVGAPSKGRRVREPRVRARFTDLRLPPVVRNPAVGIFLWSRAAIWAGALFAWLVFEPNRHPNAAHWDDPSLTRDLGWVTDVWARWDSVWFLRIGEHGYGATHGVAAAFYPLYPLVLGGAGRTFGGHYVTAGIAVSLAAALTAFVLLYRLAETRLGAEGARRAVLYLAVFPTALFLGAVYSESLFLALAIGAFLLGERRQWLGAGVAAGLAMLTRVAGVALLPALAVMAWRRPERRRALLDLCAAPLIFSAYPIYLAVSRGDALAFARSQGFWNRHVSHAGPLGGIWDGLRSAWAGVEQLVSGSHTHVYWTPVQDTDPMRAAAVNLEAFAFLILLLALTVLAWRRFGAPYGLFCAVSLAIPLSAPSTRWPLLSMPRFGLVLFPCFMALAVIGGRPKAHTAILVVSSIMLGVAVTQWALWQWVA